MAEIKIPFTDENIVAKHKCLQCDHPLFSAMDNHDTKKDVSNKNFKQSPLTSGDESLLDSAKFYFGLIFLLGFVGLYVYAYLPFMQFLAKNKLYIKRLTTLKESTPLLKPAIT